MVYDLCLDDVPLLLHLLPDCLILGFIHGLPRQEDASAEGQGIALFHPCPAYLVALLNMRYGSRDKNEECILFVGVYVGKFCFENDVNLLCLWL